MHKGVQESLFFWKKLFLRKSGLPKGREFKYPRLISISAYVFQKIIQIVIKKNSLDLSSHHLEQQLFICSIFWERENWNITSLVILLSGLFDLTRGARTPKSSASFPSHRKDSQPFDVCHLGSCGKETRKLLHLSDVAHIHTAVCSARLSELIRNAFCFSVHLWPKYYFIRKCQLFVVGNIGRKG